MKISFLAVFREKICFLETQKPSGGGLDGKGGTGVGEYHNKNPHIKKQAWVLSVEREGKKLKNLKLDHRKKGCQLLLMKLRLWGVS